MKLLAAVLNGCCILGLCRAARGAPTVITFEDLPINSTIGYGYAGRGIVFTNDGIGIGPFLNDVSPPVPHSGGHVAEFQQGEFLSSTPLSFDFTSPQSDVALYGCSNSPNALGVLKAFDARNHQIAQIGPLALDQGCKTVMSLHAAGALIKHAEYGLFFGNNPAHVMWIDDLTFAGGKPPPPTPTDVPVVRISSPASASVNYSPYATFVGGVVGNGLTGVLKATVDHKRMSWDQAEPYSYSIQLSNKGLNATYSTQIALPLGLVTITASAGNVGGKQGTASDTFTNLPPGIRDGNGSLGVLNGVLDASPSCQVAIYAEGALAWNGSQTYLIGTRMLPKWIAWMNAARFIDPASFCPTEQSRIVLGNTTRQNFVDGRLYDNSVSVFFVSSTFRNAIDLLGGEEAVGVPIADPLSAPAAHTWQFQRFDRQLGGLLTTIEFKGLKPTLYMERQGGDLRVLTSAGLKVEPSTATLVDTFSCSGEQGPCAVIASARSGPGAGGASRYCNGETFPWGPPEWVSVIPKGDFIPTPLMGWVTDSGPSNEDYGLTHQFNFANDAGTLWADWTLFVHPLDSYANLLASNDKIEVEVEYYTAQYLFIAYDGQPLEGDLYFVAGRWIIDCGHSDYSSEIHPPFVTSRIRTVGSGDAAQTSALMWVNGYYYSGQAVQLKLYPPPRPTPVSFLTVTVPDATDAAFDVNVNNVLDDGSTDPDYAAWVLAHFSASPKSVSLGYGGLLPFSSGRVYQGAWSIGWQQDLQFQSQTLGNVWWP